MKNLKKLMEKLKEKKIKFLNKISDNWYFLYTGSNSGLFNMSCDNFLLEYFSTNKIKIPILRLYCWDKETISLGANQSLIENYIKDFPVVKRKSGGHAVIHSTEINEITYSLILNTSIQAKKIYFELGEVFSNFLSKYKLSASFGYADDLYLQDFDCFNSKTSADLVVKNIKVIGSAQFRRKDYVLTHGSIKIDRISKLSGKTILIGDVISNLKDSFINKLNIGFMDYTLNDNENFVCTN